MLYAILIVSGVMCFLFSDNKYLSYTLTFLIWILFSFSSNTADYAIYYRRFYNNSSEATEPLFNLLVKLLNLFHLDLQWLIFIIGTLFIISVIYVINRMCLNPGFVLALYLLYPYFMDVTQMRNTLSFAPILFGLPYLFENNKKADLKFILCVVISALCHYSGFLYLLLLLCKKIDIKKTIKITVIVIVLVSSMTQLDRILVIIATRLGISAKVLAVLNHVIMQDSHTVFATKRMMVIMFILICILLIYVKRNIRWDKREIIDYVIKINIIIMVVVPLLDYAVDLFRIQRYLLIITYIAFEQYIEPKYNRIYCYGVKTLAFKIGCLIVPVFGFYMNIYRSGLIENVIHSVMDNNILFQWR